MPSAAVSVRSSAVARYACAAGSPGVSTRTVMAAGVTPAWMRAFQPRLPAESSATEAACAGSIVTRGVTSGAPSMLSVALS